MFTARFQDEETGLMYYRARHYAPKTGRFLQRDPKGYGPGPNLMEYASSSPASRVDPTGRESMKEAARAYENATKDYAKHKDRTQELKEIIAAKERQVAEEGESPTQTESLKHLRRMLEDRLEDEEEDLRELWVMYRALTRRIDAARNPPVRTGPVLAGRPEEVPELPTEPTDPEPPIESSDFFNGSTYAYLQLEKSVDPSNPRWRCYRFAFTFRILLGGLVLITSGSREGETVSPDAISSSLQEFVDRERGVGN
jgi:RHS repeat-associated protein